MMMLCKDKKKRRECCSPMTVIWIALATGAGALGMLAYCKRKDLGSAMKEAGKKCAGAVDTAVERVFGDGACDCE